jgi:hypothetical protein
MKHYILILLLALLGGCSMANLTYDGEQLVMQIDEKQLSVNGTPISSFQDNYNNLYLFRESLRLDDGTVVIYEDARTDIFYEYNFGTSRTIRAIFDAKKVKELYSKSFFYIFQVLLKDGRTLNVAAQLHDDQRLSFVYGMSNKHIKNLLKHLDAKAKKPITPEVITADNEKAVLLSKWSTQMVHFTPLITPARHLRGR